MILRRLCQHLGATGAWGLSFFLDLSSDLYYSFGSTSFVRSMRGTFDSYLRSTFTVRAFVHLSHDGYEGTKVPSYYLSVQRCMYVINALCTYVHYF